MTADSYINIADLGAGNVLIAEAFAVGPSSIPSIWQAPRTSTSVFASETLNRQLAAAAELSEDDWDGDGAIKITDSVIGNTRSIGSQLVVLGIGAPEVVPNNNGTISLEWERSDGKAYLEIGNTQFSFFFRSRTGNAAYVGGATKDFRSQAATVLQSLLVATPFAKNSTSPWVVALECNVV